MKERSVNHSSFENSLLINIDMSGKFSKFAP